MISYRSFKLQDRPSKAIVLKILAQSDFAHNRLRVIKTFSLGRLTYVLQKYSQSSQSWEDSNRTNILNESLAYLHFVHEVKNNLVKDGELLMQTSNRFLFKHNDTLDICRLAVEGDDEYIEDEETFVVLDSYLANDQEQALKKLLYFFN